MNQPSRVHAQGLARPPGPEPRTADGARTAREPQAAGMPGAGARQEGSCTVRGKGRTPRLCGEVPSSAGGETG